MLSKNQVLLIFPNAKHHILQLTDRKYVNDVLWSDMIGTQKCDIVKDVKFTDPTLQDEDRR